MMPLLRVSNVRYWRRAVCAALIGSLALLLPSCGIPKLHGPEPAPGLPPDFNGVTSADNSALLPPQEFFDDPRLTSLIDQALWGNQQLRILTQDIAIANNEIWKRSGAYLPFLSLGGTASYEKLSTYTPLGADLSQIVSPNGNPFPNPLPDFLMAADITWQIDIWRQLRNARDAAGMRYLGTIDGRNYVVTRLIAEIAENYYNLMALDKQLETLDLTIAVMEQSYELAKAQKQGARGTELGVQRFLAEVRKNQSQKLIIYQEIVETENRINFLCGRFPQPVERNSTQYLDMQLRQIGVGVPPQLLQNRADIRQAERELQAAGLDIRVARANFYPKLIITSGVGYEAFNPRYIFYTPESLIYGVAGNLVAPLINRRAIQADYMNANSKQLQALYEYQRTILNAFTEVINRMAGVQNYSGSIDLKRQQLASLESAVDFANKLFQNARVEYLDVLTALRDRNDARLLLIDTKQSQLTAIINLYQALGGGWRFIGAPMQMEIPPAALQRPVEQMPNGPPAEALPGPARPAPVIQGPVAPAMPAPVVPAPGAPGPALPGTPPPDPQNQPPGPAVPGATPMRYRPR